MSLGMRPKSGLGMRPKSGLGMRPKSGLGMRPKSGSEHDNLPAFLQKWVRVGQRGGGVWSRGF